MNSEQKNIDLEIGQVIYVLSNKQQKIIPAIVIEEAVIRTLNGNQTTWKVSVGPAGKEVTIDSNRLDGEIYVSLEEIKEALHNRLLTFLEEILEEAAGRASAWYGESNQALSYVTAEGNTGKIDPDRLLQDIESSQQKKSTLRPPFKKTNFPQQKKNPTDIIRERMDAMISEEPENRSRDEAEVVGVDEISLPDGQRVKVNVKI